MQENYPTLKIKNFKKFKKEQLIELTPLLVLVGPNGGGKSTIIDAINFFNSIINNPFLFEFSDIEDFSNYTYNNESTGKIDFSFSFSYDDKPCCVSIELTPENQKPLCSNFFIQYPDTEIVLNYIYSKKYHVFADENILFFFEQYFPELLTTDIDRIIEEERQIIGPDTSKTYNLPDDYSDVKRLTNIFFDSENNFELKVYNIFFSHKTLNILEKYMWDVIISQYSQIFGKPYEKYYDNILTTTIYCIYRDGLENHIINVYTYETLIEILSEVLEDFKFIYWVNDDISMKTIIHINIDEARKLPPSYFVFKNNNWVDDYYGILSIYKSNKTDERIVAENFIKTMTSKYLKYFEIADNIELKKITEISSKEFLYKLYFINGESQFEISKLSSGGKQILPIIINCITNLTVAIKQPELHLHPKIQMKLADLFIETYSNSHHGLSRIIETHSEHLIRKFQLLIASGTLLPKDISFYYTTPVTKTNESNILKLEIDDRGIFITAWPNGFFEESHILNIQLIEEIIRRKN